VEQYRHGTQSITLEIPGGMVDPGEDMTVAGVRELREETGFIGDNAELIGVVEPNPAFQNNRCGTLLVRGVRQVAAQDLDPNEEIRVRLEPLERIPELIRSGAITHSLVVAAFHHLSLRQAGRP
jgi:8-oxo-dGTP pyrophosphatase MutT (NUDIX family)